MKKDADPANKVNALTPRSTAVNLFPGATSQEVGWRWSWSSPASASCGTIFVGTLFYINLDTPVVKASGRELTCALLFGLLSCYVFSFFLLAEPSTVICAIQRFWLGFFILRMLRCHSHPHQSDRENF
ncbi:Metabotropic glutamate receptor 2 [Desmophyllum pertusum]|uniref:Metabotropic glutamate receptor 2 n=1 Tax=Desmophyllum pertusum TaxID=174260 RepID=A0A9W9ZC17_9CNID|nr:Metabotropic glutamate receptor 2 [Desmophyllum pertusum]